MLIVDRQSRLLEILRERKTAQLDDLAAALDVSASTVRRDLEALAKRGRVERTHGGAIYLDEEAVRAPMLGQDPVQARMAENRAAKERVGRVAAAMVQPHMTLLLDGGSTVVIAAQMIEVRPIQVVTNSLMIANLFSEDEQVELTLVGGQLYPRSGVMVGPMAMGCLADLNADLCFFSVASIDSGGLYNINVEMARVEQMMIQQASRSVLLMDASKFDRKSLVRVCGLAEVDQIIADGGVDEGWQSRLGERLILASSG